MSDVHADRVTAQAGALWSAVLDATLACGCTPAVLTDYLHTSVGGTLTVGGVGGGSHRYGLQVDRVEVLEVVMGTGQLVTCSPEHNRRLFDAVRAGLGQCGIIISATVSVIPAPARARRYRLRYHDLATFLTDQRKLAMQGRFDFLEGQILPAASGTWRYLLETATYYTPPAVAVDAVLLNGLGHDRNAEEIDDLTVEMSPADWRTTSARAGSNSSQPSKSSTAPDPHPQLRHRQHATWPVTNDLARRRVEC